MSESGAPDAELRVVDPASPVARWAMAQYFAELDARFPTGFDPGDALDEAAGGCRPPHGVFLVAVVGDETAGCGGLQHVDDTTTEIKRMWISARHRGAGLGKRLLARLEAEGRRAGRSRVVLDTNGVLTQAIAMYRSAGYEAIDRYNDNPYAEHWFAKDLTASGSR